MRQPESRLRTTKEAMIDFETHSEGKGKKKIVCVGTKQGET